MKRPVMYGKIGRRVRELLNGYARAGEIVAPELGGDAGVLGAIALARGDG